MRKIVLFTWFGLVSVLLAQPPELPEHQLVYDVIAMPVQPGSLADVNVYIWVYYPQLQFVKDDTGFVAYYQINMEITDEFERGVTTRDSTYKRRVESYEASVDTERLYHHQFRFRLKPGRYRLAVRLKDLNSGRSQFKKVEKEIPSCREDTFAISDILLLNDSTFATNTETIISPTRLIAQDSIYIGLVACVPNMQQTYNVICRQRQRKVQELANYNFQPAMQPDTIIIPLDATQLAQGQSELIITLTDGHRSQKVSKNIVVNRGFRNRVKKQNLDEMIAQLRYVAFGDEYSNILKAEGEEKEKLFKAFWERRDVSPGTPKNELFDEYYYRVQVANQRYSAGISPGWKTDRGHVYILYGEPDRIEMHDTEDFSGRYEVWYYRKHGKKFVFYDEFGFGEYKLVSGVIR